MTSLYLLSPDTIDISTFPDLLQQVLETGNVSAFQLRLKHIEDKFLVNIVKTLLPICHKNHVPFILNDRPDLVKQLQLDGVHIGQGDGPKQDPHYIKTLRQNLGDNTVIGVSCYDSRDLAMHAAEQGADYISFGAFFPTQTKETTATPKPEIIKWWTTYTEVPCCAIGGINPENYQTLVTAGADFIAVISSVWNAEEGPIEAVKKFNLK